MENTNTLENPLAEQAIVPEPIPASFKSHLEVIPLFKIMSNPDNPRGPVDPATAQAMADSLREVGQKTEIRVRLLTEEERARFTPFEYLLIGGHVRLAGAQLAGLETLRAVVLGPMTQDEEEMAALLDNRWEPMSWWRWDLAIERRMTRDKAPSQRKLAAQLGMSHTKIYRAMKIMEFLNPAGREAIRLHLATAAPLNGDKSGTPRATDPTTYQITESILLALADLKDPLMVEKAVKVVIEGKLTESQAKKLVDWVKAGNEPETYSKSPLGYPLPKMESSKAQAKPSSRGEAPALANASAGRSEARPANESVQIETIKQKLKSGEKLKMGENLALVAHVGKKIAKAGPDGLAKGVARFLERVFGLVGKETLGALKGSVRFVWHTVKDTLRGLGLALGRIFRKIAAFVISMVILVPLLWLLGDTVFHGNFNLSRAMHGLIGFAEPVLRFIWNVI